MKIGVLGGTSTALILGVLAGLGHDGIHPKQLVSNNHGFRNQDLTNTSTQPSKSSYNSKQRKKKANRKGLSK